jgi:hypothetical protein
MVSYSKNKKNICKNIYTETISECNKLKLYSKIKLNLEQEKYLNSSNPALRKTATELRISNHNLPVEVGRHKNVAADMRTCNFCKNDVGDEEHYLMYCYHPILTKERNHFIKNIFRINPRLGVLNRKNLFIYVTTLNDNNILDVTLKYIHNIFKKMK